jgi:trehalose synthase
LIENVQSEASWSLNEYSSIPSYASAVRELRTEASLLASVLRDRTVWMINSTARGGGVAEMLPGMIAILEQLGIRTRWVVMHTSRPEFFTLTKRLHNLIHGEQAGELTPADRELYEEVNRQNADELEQLLHPDDILVVHDPQPLPMGAVLKQRRGVRTIWRSHIGLDEHGPATRAAWSFLRPYAETYDHAVFSVPEYIPGYLAGRSSIIHPALDPFSYKNRELSPHKLGGVLCNAGLVPETQPLLASPFAARAQRLRADGTFGPPTDGAEIGLPFRPVVTQVSRWDRLKGFGPLLEGFLHLKDRVHERNGLDPRHRRRLETLRLILAGPDPASIQDDPEGTGVLGELIDAYRALTPEQQADVAILSLPMASRKENTLMVNALQRCSTVVVQNSLREGFGLTATEAMAKGVGVIGTRACGLRQQIRSGIDGVLVHDPSDPEEIAARLNDVLEDVPKREAMARSAQRRVHDHFLIFTQLCQWVHLLNACASSPSRAVGPPSSNGS